MRRDPGPGGPRSSRVAAYGNSETHAAVFGEFKSVREQVFQDLLQAFGVRDDAAHQCGIGFDFESQPAMLCFVTERASNHFQQACEEDLFGFHRNRAGFDLRKVKNVADQIEQVGSGAVNGARELDLLGRQVAVGVVGQLLAQGPGCC